MYPQVGRSSHPLRYIAIVSYAGKLIWAGLSEQKAAEQLTHGRWFGRGRDEMQAIKDAEKHLPKERRAA